MPDLPLGNIHVGDFPADHHLRRDLRERDAGRLRDERHGPARTRVRLQDVDDVVSDGILNVDQPHNSEAESDLLRVIAHPRDNRGRERLRRDDAGRVAGVDSGPLDMLHDPADQDVRPVRDRVDIDLDRALEERVDQHRVFPAHPDGLFDVTFQFGLVVNEFHRPSAEDVGRSDQHRVADLPGFLPRLFLRMGGGVRRARDAEPGKKPAEPVAVFSHVHGVGRRTEDLRRQAETLDLRLQGHGQVHRVLAAELDHDAVVVVLPEDVRDVLKLHRLEEEPVGGVGIGRDRLGIVVDDMDLDPPLLAERHHRMDGAVVELDPLPDPDRPGTEDQDFLGAVPGELAPILPG